ncbi:synaptotagmin-like 3 [Cricetulus griseus]
MAHEVDLESFKEMEQEVILGVLYRDQAVQSMEKERVRVVKIKTGEWFFEERARKFPTEELSKSQNDVTSEKHLLAMDPRQCVVPTERRSQSDTAVNVTSRKVSSPDILKAFHQEDPKHPPSPVLKQDPLPASPTHSSVFSGGLRHGSLTSINSTCTEMGNFDNANVTGEIEFAIHYCFKSRSLEIHIKTCKNLAYGEEKKRKCNPYVKTYLLPDRSSQGKRKTQVQKNTLDPTFEETLKYQVELAQLMTRRLQVSVWHLGTLARRVFLGEVILPLAAWDFEDSSTQNAKWYPLRAKAEKYEDNIPQNNGELAVRAKLVLPAGPRKFQEAQEDQQKLRVKSPVLKKQACPQWKHSFVFNGVSSSQLRQSSLELTVWDQAIFGMNDRLLGGARLGSSKSVHCLWLYASQSLPVKNHRFMSLVIALCGYHGDHSADFEIALSGHDGDSQV